MTSLILNKITSKLPKDIKNTFSEMIEDTKKGVLEMIENDSEISKINNFVKGKLAGIIAILTPTKLYAFWGELIAFIPVSLFTAYMIVLLKDMLIHPENFENSDEFKIKQKEDEESID